MSHYTVKDGTVILNLHRKISDFKVYEKCLFLMQLQLKNERFFFFCENGRIGLTNSLGLNRQKYYKIQISQHSSWIGWQPSVGCIKPSGISELILLINCECKAVTIIESLSLHTWSFEFDGSNKHMTMSTTDDLDYIDRRWVKRFSTDAQSKASCPAKVQEGELVLPLNFLAKG